MIMLRRLAAVTTFAGLAGAIGASLAQVLATHGCARLGPATQMLTVIAALTGIAAERFATEQQRRRQALATLTGELLTNRVILNEMLSALGGRNAARRRIYPRLVVSAAESAIACGALAGDRELLTRLHEWHNGVVDFNRRLDLTEMLTFLESGPEAIRGFELALSRDGGRVHRISRLLDDFMDFLDQPQATQASHSA
jgi:branched-subunit amino acid ABC-type transport system permease component